MSGFLVVGIVALLAGDAAASEKCAAVDRHQATENEKRLAPQFAKEVGAKSVDVLMVFRVSNWRIYYVSTGESDEPFLFYRGDPRTEHSVTSWSGAATKSEEDEIREWVLERAPGIPKELAACFSWYVTRAREQ